MKYEFESVNVCESEEIGAILAIRSESSSLITVDHQSISSIVLKQVVVADEHFFTLHVDLALRVLDLVDSDGHDAENEEESGED